jgi:hypothetical protein
VIGGGPWESEGWRRCVAALKVCVLCGEWGAQAAHRNEGKGQAAKTDDCLTAALCVRCHAEIDQGKNLSRDMRRVLMDRAIVLTLRELVLRGWVGLTPTGLSIAAQRAG